MKSNCDDIRFGSFFYFYTISSLNFRQEIYRSIQDFLFTLFIGSFLVSKISHFHSGQDFGILLRLEGCWVGNTLET